MHDAIVRLLIASDQAFTLSECPEFRELITYLRPSAGEHLLGADAYRSRVMVFAEESKQNLGRLLAVRTLC